MEAPGKAQAFPEIFADVPPWGDVSNFKGGPCYQSWASDAYFGQFFSSVFYFSKKKFQPKKKIVRGNVLRW